MTTDINEAGLIETNGAALVQTTNFNYLDYAVASEGSLTLEVNKWHRIAHGEPCA